MKEREHYTLKAKASSFTDDSPGMRNDDAKLKFTFSGSEAKMQKIKQAIEEVLRG